MLLIYNIVYCKFLHYICVYVYVLLYEISLATKIFCHSAPKLITSIETALQISRYAHVCMFYSSNK